MRRRAPNGRTAASRVPGALLAASLVVAPALAWAWNPVLVVNDPLVRMPGTQPAQGAFVHASDGCFDCHAAYDPRVEPGFLWRGTMMSQAARDPLFWAGMTVAIQDSIYAFGRPNAADICERCHLPKGWLESRSDPANGSMMSGYDFDGVQCDVCHRMFDPFFTDTASGAREGVDWSGYWDESGANNPGSAAAAADTLAADGVEASAHQLFNGGPLYTPGGEPVSAGWTENASGQYFVSTEAEARGPFSDGLIPHEVLYSRYHKSKFFCGTCHDVSNPVLANAAYASVQPGDGATVLPSESQTAHGYHPVERTFSELMLSSFGLPGGAPGSGAFAPGVFSTARPGNAIASCQDCHMPSETGAGCGFPGAIVRPSGSAEHPKSGTPVHDLTGGNALVPFLLASTVPGSPVFDVENANLLGQGSQVLTLTLGQGVPLDPIALLAARNRAIQTLGRAASIQSVTYDPATGAASFRIQNHTGHKLITGYPEGRRMFVNARLYKAGSVIQEVNPYDAAAGTLRGLPASYSPNSPSLGAGQAYDDALVYEAHTASAITGEALTFHFLLATGFAKDNRIPPKGFRIAEAAARGAEPAWGGAPAPGLFTAAEYAGGHDDVTLSLPPGGDALELTLYYQTTSREYVEFLRDEIDGNATTLKLPTPSGEAAAYVAQTDPFLSRLKAWGGTIWQLWLHNKDVPGAAPIAMAHAKFAIDACAGQADGMPCDDGDGCTTGDACTGGACAGGAMIACDDGNGCTLDACDPQAGCVHAFNAASCDDGDLCRGPDVCAFGVCAPGPALDCDDLDGCTKDTCDPATGCAHELLPGCGGASGSSSNASSAGSAASSSSGSPHAGGAGGASGSAGAGGGGAGGAGGAGGGSDEGGCGCAIPGGGAGEGMLAAVAAVAAAIARRRRR